MLPYHSPADIASSPFHAVASGAWTTLKTREGPRQQYLTPSEEKTLVEYVLRMSNNGFLVPIKHLRSLAFIIVRQRSSILHY
jgi:hypothetical protein